MRTKTNATKRAPNPTEPDIWLQEYEASGAFDECGCRLDSAGPDGEGGAAFYMCAKHKAAPALLVALRECRKAMNHHGIVGDPAQFMADAAIDEAEGR